MKTNGSIQSTTSSVGLKRRPSAGRTRYRLPWNSQTAVDGVSLASSSGVSSAASSRIPDSNASSAACSEISTARGIPGESSSDSPPPPPQSSASSVGRRGTLNRASIDPGNLPPSLIGATKIPERKPILAPLNKDSGKQSIPWKLSESTVPLPNPVPNFSPPLLPTRATMARQSSRSRHRSRASVDSSRFGFSEPLRQSLPSDRTGSSLTVMSSRVAQSSMTQPSEDDYDPDDYVDVERDIAEDDDDEEEEEEEDVEMDCVLGGDGVPRDQSDSPFDVSNVRLSKLTSGASLCRSIDSEASEVSSIRSAASHRRAMRLFQQAEQNRCGDDSDRRNICQPLHVSVTESHFSTPSLAPAVTPALPIHRTMPQKAYSKRRGTLTNQSLVGASHVLSCGDLKTSGSASASGSLNSTKQSSHSGATFRENPDYAALVIGRAAVGINAQQQSQQQQQQQQLQPFSTPDLHRLSHSHPSSDRRPLKGQHNIHTSLSPQSLGGGDSQADSPSITPLSTADSSSPINVIGRSVFESLQAPQANSKSSISLDTNSRGGGGGDRTSSSAPSPSDGSSPSDRPVVLDPDERPIRPSVQPLKPDSDSNAIGECHRETFVSDGQPTPSNKLRQRMLQKKTKELQKLRQVTTTSKSGPTFHIGDPACLSDDQLTMTVLNSSFGSQAPPSSTWPPTTIEVSPQTRHTMSSNLISNGEDRVGGVGGSGAGTTASLPPKYRGKKKLEGHETNQVESPMDAKVSPQRRTPSVQRVQSSGCLANDRSPRGSHSPGRAREDDRPPLVKGQSTLNLPCSASASSSCASPNLPFVLQLINAEDWESKVSGLESLAQLACDKSARRSPSGHDGVVSAGSARQPQSQGVFHADALNQAVQAVIIECRNLRSQVSRQAVQTLSTLFHGLGKLMDPHVEICVRVLLGKTGEAAAAFLRDEVAVALDELSESASPCRTLTAFLQHGPGHKNPAVRLQTAMHVSRIMETLACSNNPPRIDGQRGTSKSTSDKTTARLSSWNSATNLQSTSSSYPSFVGGMMDKLVTALSQFLTDGNQETRYYGRRLLKCLKLHPDFERLVRKQLSGQTLRAVQDAMDQVQTKGVGEPPSASAGTRRRGFSPAPSPSASRGSSAGTVLKS